MGECRHPPVDTPYAPGDRVTWRYYENSSWETRLSHVVDLVDFAEENATMRCGAVADLSQLRAAEAIWPACAECTPKPGPP